MDPSPLSKADKPKDRNRVAQGPSSSQDKGGGFPGQGASSKAQETHLGNLTASGADGSRTAHVLSLPAASR